MSAQVVNESDWPLLRLVTPILGYLRTQPSTDAAVANAIASVLRVVRDDVTGDEVLAFVRADRGSPRQRADNLTPQGRSRKRRINPTSSRIVFDRFVRSNEGEIEASMKLLSGFVPRASQGRLKAMFAELRRERAGGRPPHIETKVFSESKSSSPEPSRQLREAINNLRAETSRLGPSDLSDAIERGTWCSVHEHAVAHSGGIHRELRDEIGRATDEAECGALVASLAKVDARRWLDLREGLERTKRLVPCWRAPLEVVLSRPADHGPAILPRSMSRDEILDRILEIDGMSNAARAQRQERRWLWERLRSSAP